MRALFVWLICIITLLIKHSRSQLSYKSWVTTRLEQQFVAMTIPLVQQYSRSNILENMSFMMYSGGDMCYSIVFPTHWTTQTAEGDYSGREVLFLPPKTEGGVQSLRIRVDDLSYTDFTAKTYSDKLVNQLVEGNPSVVLKSRSIVDIGNRSGSQIIYSLPCNDHKTTRCMVVFVENKRGYVVTYQCTSSLFRYLKSIFYYMLNSFSIADTPDDLKEHTLTVSNSLAISWKDVAICGCVVQVPDFWETCVMEPQLFLKSVCSKYDMHFFSLTYLFIDLHSIPSFTPGKELEIIVGVFKQNVANQKSMSLLNEVAIPLEQNHMAISYVSKGLFRNIPVKAWSFISVVNATQLFGCICTFTCSADVFDDFSQLGLFAWKTIVIN